MRFLHLSDLHLGKRIFELSLLEEQRHLLDQVAAMAGRIDALLLAGDIYDKPVPPAEAVGLFDDFLVRLARRETQVFIISGNHDSPERIAFGARLMDRSGIHLSPVYDGHVEPVALEDEHGTVNIYMLPFLKPAHVRRFFPEEEIDSYTDALRTAVRAMEIDPAARNVLVTHQFVTGAARCDSEDISVGGTDNVDVTAFDGFDYVALGHIHNPQQVVRETVRYCGTPLKYSFSEAGHEKSVTVAELGEKGDISIRTAPLIPLRDMKELRGSYEDLTRRSFYENTTWREDYTHITLTDEEDIPDAVGKLRVIYRNLMKLDYDNRRTRSGGEILGSGQVEKKSPLELFSELYEKQNNQPMTEEQRAFAAGLIRTIWEDGQ